MCAHVLRQLRQAVENDCNVCFHPSGAVDGNEANRTGQLEPLHVPEYVTELKFLELRSMSSRKQAMEDDDTQLSVVIEVKF